MAFIQASFLALPIVTRQMDYLVLSGIMYSSIPGRQARQAWLRNLSTLLRTGGVAMVSFLIVEPGNSDLPRRPTDSAHGWLDCLERTRHISRATELSSGHFLHAFLSEEELRSEMTETGATIVQLNWERQFAVLAWPR